MKRYLHTILLFMVISLSLGSSLFADTKVNRAVVTFSPLIIQNVNNTQNLYEVICSLFNNETDPLRKLLDASGALWSVSTNNSGIQITISSALPATDLYKSTLLLLDKIFTQKEKILTPRNDIKPEDRLYIFILNTENPALTTNTVTLRLYDSKGNDITEITTKNNPDPQKLTVSSMPVEKSEEDSAIESDNTEETVVAEPEEINIPKLSDSLSRFKELYKQAKETNLENPVIQPVTNPILAKILRWENPNLEAFISASLIKNKILYSPESENDVLNAEIFNTGDNLALVVIKEVKDNDLYNQHMLMEKKIEEAIIEPGPKEWESWSTKITEVMANDHRDYYKKVMLYSWLKHWQTEDFTEPEKLEYQKYDIKQEVEIFATEKEHTFFLGSNTFPAVYACNQDYDDNIANISICLKGHSKMITAIEELVGTSLKISIPIIVNKMSEDEVTLSFTSEPGRAPVHISKLKSSISELLYTKFKVTDLKASIRIGIAGESPLPAYQLHGLMVSGWGRSHARYESKPAETSDLNSFISSSPMSAEALKLRWQHLIDSPMHKVNLLSKLACNNLTIDTWERK